MKHYVMFTLLLCSAFFLSACEPPLSKQTKDEIIENLIERQINEGLKQDKYASFRETATAEMTLEAQMYRDYLEATRYGPMRETAQAEMTLESKQSRPPSQNAATPCVSWQNAATYMNQNTCVRGTVYVTNFDQKSKTFFINFDNTSSSFYGVSFKYQWNNLKGQCVEMHGRIQSYNNRPQIIIDNPSQLRSCQ